MERIEKSFNKRCLFRGSPDDFDLLPSLYWKKVEFEDGQGLYRVFRQKVSHFIETPDYDSFDFYSLARHFGLATRHIDWTTSAIIALYFAVYETRPGKPVVWCLNCDKMNKESIGIDSIVTSLTDHVKQFLNFDHQHETPEKAIAVMPKLNNNRIGSQQGYFTIHGKSTLPLDTQFPSCLKKIYIDPDKAEEIRDCLRVLGIKRSIAFPDLEHLIQDIHEDCGILDSRNGWDS